MDILAQIGKSIVVSLPSIGLGGIIGSLITNIIKNRLELNSENRRRIRDAKEQQYRDFLNNLLGFFKAWEDDALKLQFIWDVCANAPVYASDEVIRLAQQFIKSFDEKNKLEEVERQKIYAKLVITIRNELNKISGGSESELNKEEVEVFSLTSVKENVRKQFLDNMHPKIKL